MPRLLQPRLPLLRLLLSPGIPLVLLWFFSHAPQLPLFNSGWATRGGLRKGEGSVEKFFSFARTHRKRYFIEFFVAQSESAPKIVVGTKFSISFSILVHLPATVATPPRLPLAACCSFTLLLASFF